MSPCIRRVAAWEPVLEKNLLIPRLNGPRSHETNLLNGLVRTRRTPRVQKEQACNRAGPAETAFAVNDDALAPLQAFHPLGSQHGPTAEEPVVGRVPIGDGETVPCQAVGLGSFWQIQNAELLEFVRLEERDEVVRSPLADGLEISAHIRVPPIRRSHPADPLPLAASGELLSNPYPR